MVSFETDMASPLKSFGVVLSPIQEGSGDPSPENVRPITGFDGIEITRIGKNLCSPESVVHGSWIRAGNVTSTNVLGSVSNDSSWSCSDFMSVLPSTQYTTIVPKYTAAGAAGLVFYADKTVESAISGVTTSSQRSGIYTFTTPSNCRYLMFSWGNTNGDAVMLAYGAESTYEEYSGSIIPISWVSDVDTVYGGYLELLGNGGIKLTVNKMQTIINGSTNFTCRTSGVCYTRIARPYLKPRYGGGAIMCDRLFPDSVSLYDSCQNGTIALYNSSGISESDYVIWKVSDDVKTKSQMIAWLNENPLQVVTDLYNPVTHTLAPSEVIHSLRGTNHIWSNANSSMTVDYWTHKTQSN
jgi:hypothetical protein